MRNQNARGADRLKDKSSAKKIVGGGRVYSTKEMLKKPLKSLNWNVNYKTTENQSTTFCERVRKYAAEYISNNKVARGLILQQMRLFYLSDDPNKQIDAEALRIVYKKTEEFKKSGRLEDLKTLFEGWIASAETKIHETKYQDWCASPEAAKIVLKEMLKKPLKPLNWKTKHETAGNQFYEKVKKYAEEHIIKNNKIAINEARNEILQKMKKFYMSQDPKFIDAEALRIVYKKTEGLNESGREDWKNWFEDWIESVKSKAQQPSINDVVCIYGLNKSTKHNGAYGKIIKEYATDGPHRWEVKIFGESNSIGIQGKNLHFPVPQDRAKVARMKLKASFDKAKKQQHSLNLQPIQRKRSSTKTCYASCSKNDYRNKLLPTFSEPTPTIGKISKESMKKMMSDVKNSIQHLKDIAMSDAENPIKHLKDGRGRRLNEFSDARYPSYYFVLAFVVLFYFVVRFFTTSSDRVTQRFTARQINSKHDFVRTNKRPPIFPKGV